MNKQVAESVVQRSKMLCEYHGCGSNNMTQLHHIVKGRGKRQKHETEQSVICLCYDHHYGTEFGVHGKNGHNTDIELKLQLQHQYRLMGKSEDEIRRMMGGKLYSEDDYR